MTLLDSIQFRWLTARRWPKWRQASTFDDLGELVADWLLGADTFLPWHGPVDTETGALTDALVVLNRGRGLFTETSQPALRTATARQRAHVAGFATGRTAHAIRALGAESPSLRIDTAPVLDLPRPPRWSRGGVYIPVTQDQDARGATSSGAEWKTSTWAGVPNLEDLLLPPEAITLIPEGAEAFSVIDLQWSRHHFLWETLVNRLPARSAPVS